LTITTYGKIDEIVLPQINESKVNKF